MAAAGEASCRGRLFFFARFFWWANYLQFFTENRVHSMTFRHPVIFVLCLVLAGIPERVFAIDVLGTDATKYHKQLRLEHKKMNSRLDQVINEKLKALQSSQESLLGQIEAIKNTLPEIQGLVEVNKSETVKSIGEVNQKLVEMEARLNDILRNETKRQKEAEEKLEAELIAQFEGLKSKLTEDIETLSQNNNQYLQEFSLNNNDRLFKIKGAVEDQNKALNETQVFLKDGLIPALEKQGDANRKALQAEMVRANTEQVNSLQAHQKAVVASLNKVVASLNQMDEANLDRLGKMKKVLEDQNKALNGTQAFLKDGLIPALEKQDDANRKALQAEMVRANTEQVNSLQAHQKAVVTSLIQMDQANHDRLVKMKKALEDQNKALTETQTFFQTFFKGELIPALEKQNEANRKALQAEMVRANTEQTNSLQASQQTVVGSLNQVVTSLNQMGGKNKSLVQILEKGIKADEETKLLAETLLANIVETNKNIDQNRKTMGVLQEILNQRLTSAAQEQASGEARVTRAVQKNTELINNNLKVADEKINRLAATLKTLEVQKIETDSALNTLLNTLKEDLGHVQASNQTADPKLNILIDASQQIAAQSSQIQLGLQESVKGVGASQAKVDLANQKLAKLIEILKTIAAEQEKAQQVLKGQGKVLNTQQAIKKALVDLKNKANVNISRNNAILKKIGK